jgi:hypothetical protein
MQLGKNEVTFTKKIEFFKKGIMDNRQSKIAALHQLLQEAYKSLRDHGNLDKEINRMLRIQGVLYILEHHPCANTFATRPCVDEFIRKRGY